MKSVKQFLTQHKEFGFDFSQPISGQERIYDTVVLTQLPSELEASYRSGSRGRPNLNQPRTHSQCATCKRALRNDFFYMPPSLMARNVIYSHCKNCTQEKNTERYETTSTEARIRREAIWAYLTYTKCTHCGFDLHVSALDLHHTGDKKPGQTDAGQYDKKVQELVALLASTSISQNAERLLRELKMCVPLCSNCHRMVHAGVVEITGASGVEYHLAELVKIISRIQT